MEQKAVDKGIGVVVKYQHMIQIRKEETERAAFGGKDSQGRHRQAGQCT